MSLEDEGGARQEYRIVGPDEFDLRRGWISLAIGLGFLILFFALGQVVITSFGETPLSSLARESLLIGGWVAMWKPLEIFLYDWWPIVGERRLET